MAAIDQATEQRIAERRAKQRHLQNPPFLIHTEDGRLYPHTKLSATNPKYRPYHGDPKATLDDRMRYLKGLAGKRQVVFSEPDEPFDIGTADADSLVMFAMDQYGVGLDPAKPLAELRRKVADLAKADLVKAEPANKLQAPPERPMGLGGGEPFDA